MGRDMLLAIAPDASGSSDGAQRMSFDSTKNTLEKLLEQVNNGTLQLPEFQRDYVWPEEAVVSLLASVAKGYPVGALLFLERGGEVDFQPRPIEGTRYDNVEP